MLLLDAWSSPSASCSSCEMTSTDLSASLEETEAGGGVDAGRGRELDKTGVLGPGQESLVGNKTSETTCESKEKQ